MCPNKNVEFMRRSAVMPTYSRADLTFTRGTGAHLFDTKGRRYLDFCSGIAVNTLGHTHPHLVQALKEQIDKLWHCSNLYRIPAQEELAERLVSVSFADVAFFCNSGAEAVECALKAARKYYDAVNKPEKFRVIVMDGAFHGRTLATLSAGGQKKHIDGFEPAVEGFDHVPFGDIDAVRTSIGPQTAAILLEPVQCESGIHVAQKSYLRELRALADLHDVLLILDEVQTGLYRTGRMFAYEWFEITPDIVTLAKGLGGGFPIGCCLATNKAAKGMTEGSHASTFGGNPLAMTVGNAVLDVLLSSDFTRTALLNNKLLLTTLERMVHTYPTIFLELRGLGALFGLRCAIPNTVLYNHLQQAGLLTALAGDNVLRLLPPLIFSESEIREADNILSQVCQQLVNEYS